MYVHIYMIIILHAYTIHPKTYIKYVYFQYGNDSILKGFNLFESTPGPSCLAPSASSLAWGGLGWGESIKGIFSY